MSIPRDLVQQIIPSTVTEDPEKAHDIEKGGSLQKNLQSRLPFCKAKLAGTGKSSYVKYG